jgi:hypothetical protein
MVLAAASSGSGRRARPLPDAAHREELGDEKCEHLGTIQRASMSGARHYGELGLR